MKIEDPVAKWPRGVLEPTIEMEIDGKRAVLYPPESEELWNAEAVAVTGPAAAGLSETLVIDSRRQEAPGVTRDRWLWRMYRDWVESDFPVGPVAIPKDEEGDGG